MAEVDPEILLQWLALGQGDERDMQVSNDVTQVIIEAYACPPLVSFFAFHVLCLIMPTLHHFLTHEFCFSLSSS